MATTAVSDTSGTSAVTRAARTTSRVASIEYHPDRHVYVSNNRFAFSGGVYRDYRRPVIRERYRDYRYRPRFIVESYDPVVGYVWMPGAWQWNGGEWLWFGGHYVVEGAY